jgi:hypothetical protein
MKLFSFQLLNKGAPQQHAAKKREKREKMHTVMNPEEKTWEKWR